MWQDAPLQGSVNMFMDISAHLRQSGCQTILFISQAIKMGATISVAWSAFTLLEKIRAVCQPLIPIVWLDSDMSSCVVRRASARAFDARARDARVKTFAPAMWASKARVNMHARACARKKAHISLLHGQIKSTNPILESLLFARAW